MKTQSYLPHVMLATALLLLFGGLGAYWPSWVGAAPVIFTPQATVADAITYQGYLTDPDGRTALWRLYHALCALQCCRRRRPAVGRRRY